MWAELCAVLQQPQLVAQALERAHRGAWVPGELRRRQASLRSVQAGVARQRQRLLEAYLAEVIDLAAFQRQDRTLAGQESDLLAREREVAAQGERLAEVSATAHSMTAVLELLRVGLGQAGFEQRRQLVELLIDRVVVTDGKVEIRYVIPITPASTTTQFCHLRTDYFHVVALPVADAVEAGRPARPATLVDAGRDGVGDAAAAQQPPARLVAVATVGQQMVGPLARSTASVWPRQPDGVQQRLELGRVVSLPGVSMTAKGRPLPSTARCSLVVSPPRLCPSASSCGCVVPLFGRRGSLPGGRRRRAGGHAPRCCRR